MPLLLQMMPLHPLSTTKMSTRPISRKLPTSRPSPLFLQLPVVCCKLSKVGTEWEWRLEKLGFGLDDGDAFVVVSRKFLVSIEDVSMLLVGAGGLERPA